MNMPELKSWLIKPDCDTEQLVALLSEKFKLDIETQHDFEIVTLMDDFDWDIWNAGCVLLKSAKNTWTLYSDHEAEALDNVKTVSRFWWDLADSKLRSQLKEIIDLRAVIPVTKVQIFRTQIALRNADEKIVARIFLTELKDVDSSSDKESTERSYFIQIKSLRGYQGPFKSAIKLLQPCLEQEMSSVSMKSVLLHHGIGPAGDDSNLQQYGITRSEPVEQAIRQMSLAMLQVARKNEAGVIDDIDTEFLHQYRVSLRKTRSLLNLMKAALPAEVHLRLKALLAELSGVTNMLRDLDVFLLEHDYYCNMLPDNFEQGVNHLFKMVAADRERARKQVVSSFTSKNHALVFDEVLELLRADPIFESAVASKPVFQVAKKKTLNRYRRISIIGSEIHEGTPDEEVHDLRIECKKLRYLMEFFAELFPKKRIKNLIKSLKKLQTILGNFNDYSVQKEFLANYEKSHKKTADLSAAINGLIAVLHQKQIEERTKVQKAFADFNDEEVSAEFEALFGKQKVNKS